VARKREIVAAGITGEREDCLAKGPAVRALSGSRAG
jgi:hypothetical protein